MDDALKKSMSALENDDECVAEEAYLKIENDNLADFADLSGNVGQLSEDESANNINQSDYEQYRMREKILGYLYEKVDAHEVYREAFPEDSLQICDELDTRNGVGNAIRLDVVKRSYKDKSGKVHYEERGVQSVITDDLRFLFVRPKKIQYDEIVMSNVNLNSYFGNRRLTKRIDKIYGLIVEVDDVLKESQVSHIVDEIQQEHIPKPNFLVNSGHGLHFYYLLDEPILFHGNSDSVRLVLTNILNGIKDLIWTPLASDSKPETMDLNKGYSIIGTRNRKNKDLIVTAYRVEKKKCTLQYLRAFIDKPDDDPKYDITFPKPSKISKKKDSTATEKKACSSKGRQYEWFLELLKVPGNVRHGNRYKCMVAVAVFGVKSGIKREDVENDLKSLLEWFNSVEKEREDSDFILDENDIKAALYVYNEKYTRMLTFDWIKKWTGIEYEKKTKRRVVPLSRAENLKIARQKRDEKYPNGSWRAYSDGSTKQKILDFIKKNPVSDIKECIGSGVCSRSSAYRYWDECRKELGLSTNKIITNAEKIKKYRQSKPDATKADCIRELGLSKPTVYKYWD